MNITDRERCVVNVPSNIPNVLLPDLNLFLFQELREDMPSILADVFSILGKFLLITVIKSQIF